MLKQLKRYPHPHIVTHLFTWTQQETFYMLFPKASCNLRDYMTKQPLRDPLATSSPSGSHVYIPPDQSMRCPLLDATFVTWLLRQLLGLAEAIDHIHHLIGDAVQVPVQLAPSSARGPGTRATGFHHDIKPDNILVFTDGSDYYGTFKIGDFGSGRLNTFRSGTQRSPFEERSLGTPTYEGPDLYLLGTASRPYDLWSLGCVFLDILLWCFNPGQGGAENFATERGEAMPDQPNYQTDRFWYPSGGEGSAKRALLKDAVKKRIQDLAEHHCKGRRAFEKLISLVKRMFEIDARKRITATQLKSDVEAILRQAEIDLDSEPNCYIRAADFDALPESSIPIPRTPSTIPSRRPSLREINTANFGPQLSPLDAQSPPDLYRRRSESIGRLQTAFTSNTGGHLSQSVAVQEDGLADPLRDGRSQEQQQSFVRPWADNDVFGPKLESP
jgi:serine/threonine protein kinase